MCQITNLRQFGPSELHVSAKTTEMSKLYFMQLRDLCYLCIDNGLTKKYSHKIHQEGLKRIIVIRDKSGYE